MTKTQLIQLLLDDSSVVDQGSSLHIHHESYNIAGHKVILYWALGTDEDPDVEVDGEMID